MVDVVERRQCMLYAHKRTGRFTCFYEFVNVYIVPVQPDVVYTNTQMLISGILNLLEQCPPEMVQARRELLNSVKFFYGSDVSFWLC